MSDADDRAIATVAARLSEAAAAFAIASGALALIAFAALAFVDQPPRAAWTWWIVALLGGFGPWYALRLRFDARVFADLAADGGDVRARAIAFDGALAAVLARERVAERPIAERAGGAWRLAVRLVSVTAVQFALALFAVLPL